MNQLKETREERSREERKEKQQQQRARELWCDWFSRGALARSITQCDLQYAAAAIGMPKEEVVAWLKYMEEVDWRLADGVPVTHYNFRRSLRMWHKTQRRIDERGGTRGEAREKKRREEAEAAEAAARRRREEAAKNPAAWELCRDRCLFAKAPCGCSREVECPPSMQPHPHPPEECPWFRPFEA